jgi:hypothetical protein
MTPLIPDSRWLDLEATWNGLPSLLRVRVFASPVTELSELLIITWRYPADTPTELPSPAFYRKVKPFESEAVATAEVGHLGVLVAVETGLGATRYFFYARSAVALANHFDFAILAEDDVEFSSDLDPEWNVYERFHRIAHVDATRSIP